jgi:hypothetical protein
MVSLNEAKVLWVGTMGWFYGFKLYLVVHHHGEIVAAKVTTGNVHYTQPVRE